MVPMIYDVLLQRLDENVKAAVVEWNRTLLLEIDDKEFDASVKEAKKWLSLAE